MTFRLFDAPEREPSQFVGFAGNRIDRQAEKRSDAAVQLALADPAARILLVRGGRSYLKLNDGGFDTYFAQPEAEALDAGNCGGDLARRRRARPGSCRARQASSRSNCRKPSRRSITARFIARRAFSAPPRSARWRRPLPARLACQPPVLRPLRPQDRDPRRRLQAALPELRRRAFSPH